MRPLATPASTTRLPHKTRRTVLLGGVGMALVTWVRPVFCAPTELADAIARFSNGIAVRSGRVHLGVAELVDNGNAVPLSVSVQSAMSSTDRVLAVAIFNEKNPQREVAVFRFGPAAARAAASTRIRLATTQKLVAVAHMADGNFWSHSIEVIVALAACIEGEG